MADTEAKPYTYIPEIILKKRKSNEEQALRRKAQLEQRKFANKNNKHEYIKKPEEFVKEFRYREVDLLRMKNRLKRERPTLVTPKSKLLLIIRIQGENDMHPSVRKTLYGLGLRKVFNAVFAKVNAVTLEKLQRVEPYVTYGYPNMKNVRELIYKKGCARIDNQRVPLTDNNTIEQALGQYAILCIEDIVNEIANVGPHFKEVKTLLWPSMLNKPVEGLQGSKTAFKDGGDAGNREDDINNLISKMN